MARKPSGDERQHDFFGAPVPAPVAPKPRPARPPPKPKPKPEPEPKPEPKLNGDARLAGRLPDREDGGREEGAESADALAARLSRAELRELVAALPDEALAHLLLTAVRQLRRRLNRGGGRNNGQERSSALGRAVQQLAAELGGPGDDYEF